MSIKKMATTPFAKYQTGGKVSPKPNGTMTFDEWLEEIADKMQLDESDKNTLVAWDTEAASNRCIRINMIDDFDARGMHCLYGRTDSFPKKHSFNMTIWKDQKDRLLARFWSRSKYIEWESYEIIGIKTESILRFREKDCYTDKWIPKCLRDAYDEWIIYEDW